MAKFKFEKIVNSIDGKKISFDGEIEVGTPVFVYAEDGSKIKAEDGDIILEDGTVVTVKAGLIEQVIEVVVIEQTEEVETEKFDAEGKFNELSVALKEIQEKLSSLTQVFETEKNLVKEKFAAVTLVETKQKFTTKKEIPSISAYFSAMKK